MDDRDATRLAVAFARVARGAGLEVPVGTTIVLARAVAAVGLATRSEVYWAGRASLVRSPDDVAPYDRAFRAFWDAAGSDSTDDVDPVVPLTLGLDEGEGGDELPAEASPARSTGLVVPVRWSRAEVLRHRDFAACSTSELAEVQRLIADLRVTTSLRRARRRRPSARGRGAPDPRGTLRRALRTGGEPIDRAFEERRRRPRRLVLLLDVSGSMEPYSRALLRFAHAAVLSGRAVEVFTVGTQLTRVTRDLAARDVDAALSGAGARAGDWSGGTRLGDALDAFNRQWGARGVARGAVVVIVSDGWDRGDPALVDEQMARLHRIAARIVWVNPLKAGTGFAPLARGMAAALPHVDEFVAGNSLAALGELVDLVRMP